MIERYARAVQRIGRRLLIWFGAPALIAAVALTLAPEPAHCEQARQLDPVIALIDALEDPDPWVRQAAINSLGDIRDPRSEEPLRAALADTIDGVRRSAEAVLGLQQRVRTGIEVPSGNACPTVDDDELDAWIRGLSTPEKHERQRAAELLGNTCETQSVPALIEALRDTSERVRQAAAAALGNLGDERAVEPLTHVLLDPDERVRQAAAGSLGALCDTRAVQPLMASLFDPDEHVRQVAAGSLGQIADRRATPALIAALDDEDEHVRQSAAGALGVMYATVELAEGQKCAS